MKAKAIVALGDSVHRELGVLVEEKLNGFLQSHPGAEIKNLQVDADLTTVYGKALIVILYAGGEEKGGEAKGKK